MKNILVPYDFSEASENAAAYAFELARFFNSKITLFHVFQLPVVTAEASFIQYPYDELYQDSMDLLKKERSKLQKKYNKDIGIDCAVKSGFAGSSILDEVTEKKIDLVVMGITGKSKLQELVVGSNSVYVARNCTVPVMIIPSGCKYQKIKKMAFACDYDHTENGNLLEDIQLFRFMFDSKLDVVNITDTKKVPSFEKAVSGLSVENSLNTANHETYFLDNTDVEEGLNDYLENHKPDVLIIVPKKHNLFDKIFNKSITKSLAFHSHIPLLAFHQAEK